MLALTYLDIKPSNIVALDADGDAVLSGFKAGRKM